MNMNSPRIFTYSAVWRSAVLLGTLLLLIGTGFAFRTANRGMAFYGVLALTALSMLAVIEVFRSRLEFRDDDIRVVGLVGDRIYPRSQVIDVRCEAGSPASLKLADGSWA